MDDANLNTPQQDVKMNMPPAPPAPPGVQPPPLLHSLVSGFPGGSNHDKVKISCPCYVLGERIKLV